MESKQVFLTPAAGKRLIAMALARHPQVVRAMERGTLLIVAGTTNGYVAEEVLRAMGDTDFDRKRFFRGIVRRESIPKSAGALEGDVIIQRGKRIRGKTIYDVIGGMGAGDVILKGANAVNLASGETAILCGNPTSGTIGAIYGAVIGRRALLITPVGVEKRVEEPVHDLCMLTNRADASGLRLAPSIGEAFTELDAMVHLTGVRPHLVAAGGVCGCEGGAFFQCEGTQEQLNCLTEYIRQVNREKRFSFVGQSEDGK